MLSVASIPLAWVAGKKLADRGVGYASIVLLSSSPFAIHYATAARMYSLLSLLSLLGLLALARALERATFWRLAAVAVIAACLLYTHYWAMYLVVATGVWLLVRATGPSRRAPADRRSCWLCLAAMVVGSLTFLLWLPVLVFQTRHTGTPWSNAAGVGDILTILGQYDGGGTEAAVYALAVFILLLLGVSGRNIGLRRQSDLQARTTGRHLAFVLAATLILALAGAALAHTAVVSRYTAVVLPLYVLLAAMGVCAFTSPWLRAAILAAMTASGLLSGAAGNLSQRTEAGAVAAVVNKDANSGDLVLYCPDQLGPAVDRLLTRRLEQRTFPRGTPPKLIDWVDYRQTIQATNVERFAQQVLAAADGHPIWFVVNPSYPGTDDKCNDLRDALSATRSSRTLVAPDPNISSESESLIEFAK